MNFETGKEYTCEYRGRNEYGDISDNWTTATAKIVKRTPKTVTIEVEDAPHYVQGVHKTYVDGWEKERAESRVFGMIAG